MLINLSIEDFNQAIDSDSPAPGGGSVSALLSTLACSLSRMVGHLTINKKKFLALEESVQKDFTQHFEALKSLDEQLIALIDADTSAYNEVMLAFKLPKLTDEEISIRNAYIQRATLHAIEVPLLVMRLSLQALSELECFLQYGNQNALSDLGVAVLLFDSGIQGASYNVRINCSSLEDENKKQVIISEVHQILNTAKLLHHDLIARIEAKL